MHHEIKKPQRLRRLRLDKTLHEPYCIKEYDLMLNDIYVCSFKIDEIKLTLPVAHVVCKIFHRNMKQALFIDMMHGKLYIDGERVGLSKAKFTASTFIHRKILNIKPYPIYQELKTVVHAVLFELSEAYAMTEIMNA